jgi:hypothetical protein
MEVAGNRPPRGGIGGRLVLLGLAGIALLAGLDAALLLLGLPAPVTSDRLPEVHGMLLTLSFVGTLIALERAIALGDRRAYAAPALLAVGGLLLLSPAPFVVGKAAQLAGAVALVLVYVPLWRRQRDHAVLISALGAVLAVGASVLWIGHVPLPLVLPWLVGFVVLTIVGERLELARLAMPPAAENALLVCSGGVMAGAAASVVWPRVGVVGFGVVLLALVAVLLRHDVARRTVHSRGLTRYMAACMLAAYGWLSVTGIIWASGGVALEGLRYDAVIHSVFLGFTFSMIMAHAPVIFPAVTRRPLPYHPLLWVPVGVLQLSLIIRVAVGDAFGVSDAWRIGGVVGIVALLLFVLSAAGTTVYAGVRRKEAP